MSGESQPPIGSAEPAADTIERIHPQAVDFFIHAIGLDERFVSLTQSDAIALSSRIFAVYWQGLNTKLALPGAAAARYASEVDDSGKPLKERAQEMHTYLATCARQSERYVRGDSMTDIAATDYPSSSRVTAFGWMSINIRATANGIAEINSSMFRGNMLFSVIEAWRAGDPATLPAAFASNSHKTPAPLPLESFKGQLPREYSRAYAGTIALAWMVEESPFTSNRRRRTQIQPADDQTTQQPRQIPARPGDSGATERQILDERVARAAALRARATRFPPPPRPRRHQTGGDASAGSQQ